MALTEAERAVLQTRLEEARAALHSLNIGRSEVSLAYNGESITYSIADAGRLEAYIRQLEAQLGLRRSGRARSRGVVFG